MTEEPKRRPGRPPKIKPVDFIAQARADQMLHVSFEVGYRHLEDAEAMSKKIVAFLKQKEKGFQGFDRLTYKLVVDLPGSDDVQYEWTISGTGIFWAGESDDRFAIGEAYWTLPPLLASVVRDRQRFILELNARNARMGFNPPHEKEFLETVGWQACPRCGTIFKPVRAGQIYDRRQCADAVGTKKRRAEKKEQK